MVFTYADNRGYGYSSLRAAKIAAAKSNEPFPVIASHPRGGDYRWLPSAEEVPEDWVIVSRLLSTGWQDSHNF